MHSIQTHAEQSVREMLKTFALKHRLDSAGKFTVNAIDYMDDGTPIRLRVTVDGATGDACFDFSGTGPEVSPVVLSNLLSPPSHFVPCPYP